jgi:hypothetical protein
MIFIGILKDTYYFKAEIISKIPDYQNSYRNLFCLYGKQSSL